MSFRNAYDTADSSKAIRLWYVNMMQQECTLEKGKLIWPKTTAFLDKNSSSTKCSLYPEWTVLVRRPNYCINVFKVRLDICSHEMQCPLVITWHRCKTSVLSWCDERRQPHDIASLFYHIWAMLIWKISSRSNNRFVLRIACCCFCCHF